MEANVADVYWQRWITEKCRHKKRMQSRYLQFIIIQTEGGSELREAIVRGKFAIHQDSLRVQRKRSVYCTDAHSRPGTQVDSACIIRRCLCALRCAFWPAVIGRMSWRQSGKTRAASWTPSKRQKWAKQAVIGRDDETSKVKAELWEQIAGAASLERSRQWRMLS